MQVVRIYDVQQGARMPRAALLDRLREVKGCSYVPEIELLRDVIYLLQGICGKHVSWRKELVRAHEAGALEQTAAREITKLVVDESQGMIPAPVQDRIHRLAELGQLYVRVKEYVDAHTQSRETRLSVQSLCHFLSGQLSEYYKMIAELETRWHLLAEGDSNVEHLSLQSLVKSTRESLLRMRLMSTIVESCRGTNGNNLVSTIHVYTQTGDPFIRDFTSTLLDHVSRPFFHCLSRWIYDGELNDPCNEFFVALQHIDAPNSQQDARRAPESDLAVVDEQGANAADVWHSKFVLRKELLPSFLSEDFANKIFSTGRSLNFIRCSCGEDDWTAMHAKLHAIDRERTLRYSDMVGLEHAIDAVYAAASGHLVYTFLHRFRLREHLRALKEYLMLTKGDFADALMTSLGPSLSRPAHTLYQHNLSAALETAIRTSNAQYDDPDILRRLDARSLEFNAGDTGWDSFTLEYRIESPVSAVLDASAMAGYQILFNYLWKIQRVETTVTASWENMIGLQRTLLRAGQRRAGDPSLLQSTRRVMMYLNEIIHFVRQLQGFCQLEVIAYSWHGLQHEFEHHPGGDLGQLIEAHRSYLNTLISNALLRGGKRGQLDHLADEVRAQLDAILLFCAGLDDLSRHVTTELARIASGMEILPSSQKSMNHCLEKLEHTHTQFQQRLQSMIGLLERHPNLSVRDLARRWNFNLFYRRIRDSDATTRIGLPSS